MTYYSRQPISDNGAGSGASVGVDVVLRINGVEYVEYNINGGRDPFYNALVDSKGSRDWFNFPSIQALYKFCDYYIEKKSRKNCNVSELTHFFEVGDSVANYCELSADPSDIEARCFGALGHDIIEFLVNEHGIDFMTADYIVWSCWRGDKKKAEKARDLLVMITDPKNLKGEEKSKYQILIANNADDVDLGVIRTCDKKCTYVRELYVAENAGLQLRNEIERNKFTKKLCLKGSVVQGLERTGEASKNDFNFIKQALLKKVFPRSTNIGVRMSAGDSVLAVKLYT